MATTLDDVLGVLQQVLAECAVRSNLGTWGEPADYSVVVRQDAPGGAPANQYACEDVPMTADSVLGRLSTDDIAPILLDDILRIGSGAPSNPIPGCLWFDTDVSAMKQWNTVDWQLVGGVGHELLSATHTDSLTGSVARGDIVVGNATPKWSRLAVGTSNQILQSDGTDVAWVTNVSLPGTLTAASTISGTSCYLSGGLAQITRTSDSGPARVEIRSSKADPYSLLSGDIVADIQAWGSDGASAWGNGGLLRWIASENWDGTHHGTYVDFLLNGTGDYDTPLTALRIVNEAPAAVNYLQIAPGITTEPVVLEAAGSDTNIDLQLVPKGTGVVDVQGDIEATGDITGSFGTLSTLIDIMLVDTKAVEADGPLLDETRCFLFVPDEWSVEILDIQVIRVAGSSLTLQIYKTADSSTSPSGGTSVLSSAKSVTTSLSSCSLDGTEKFVAAGSKLWWQFTAVSGTPTKFQMLVTYKKAAP